MLYRNAAIRKARNDPVRNSPEYLRGRLDQKNDWFVQTPVEVVIRDGIVISARTIK